MKKIVKAVCLLTALILMFSLTACSKARPTILTYEGNTFSSAQYAFALAERKGQIVDQFASYSGKDVSSDEEFWNTVISDDQSYAEAVKTGTLEYCKIMLLTEYFCEKYDLKITDDTAITNLDSIMDKAKTEFGGEDLLSIELAKYGITIEQLRNYYEGYERYMLLREYWYGENGTKKIPESEVKAEFLENYYKIDMMYYGYYTKNDKQQDVPIVYEDITDKQAKEYFDENYVKVQHILYMTVDTNQQPLSDEKVAEAKKNANDAYNAIINGEATFEEKTKDNQDSGTEYVFTHGNMVKEFEEAAFEMKPDDIRLVETEYGLHIIKKLAIGNEDFEEKTDEVKQVISQKRIGEKANDMYEKLKSGEAEFVDGGEDAAYTYTPDIIFTEGEINEDIIKIVSEMKTGEVYLYPIVSSGNDYGYYLLKKADLEDKDLESRYSTVEDKLVTNAFEEYMKAHYDSITVNQEELDKFDVVTTVSFPYFSY